MQDFHVTFRGDKCYAPSKVPHKQLALSCIRLFVVFQFTLLPLWMIVGATWKLDQVAKMSCLRLVSPVPGPGAPALTRSQHQCQFNDIIDSSVNQC